jgi:predicted Fe-Mo cluster-binding NifX family protein
MKVAVVTDNGKTVGERFGKASMFLVLHVENGRITRREPRRKLGRIPLGGKPEGAGSSFSDQFEAMAKAIADCEVLICGGAETGACKSLADLGVKHITTTIKDIDEVVTAYVEGRIAVPAER